MWESLRGELCSSMTHTHGTHTLCQKRTHPIPLRTPHVTGGGGCGGLGARYKKAGNLRDLPHNVLRKTYIYCAFLSQLMHCSSHIKTISGGQKRILRPLNWHGVSLDKGPMGVTSCDHRPIRSFETSQLSRKPYWEITKATLDNIQVVASFSFYP